MRIRWTTPASRDLEAIGDHIAKDNAAAAAEIVTRIFDQVDMLGDHPHSGRPGRIAETRERVIVGTPYIAIYRVGDDRVEILAVFHAARRWPDRL